MSSGLNTVDLRDRDLISIQEARDLVAGAIDAQKTFATFSQNRVDAVVEACASAAADAAETLARAAVEAGIDGIFLEVHDDPASAKSDGANALDLKLLRPLLETLLAIHEASAG